MKGDGEQAPDGTKRHANVFRLYMTSTRRQTNFAVVRRTIPTQLRAGACARAATNVRRNVSHVLSANATTSMFESDASRPYATPTLQLALGAHLFIAGRQRRRLIRPR